MEFLNRIVVLMVMTAAAANALGGQSLLLQSPLLQSPPVERSSGCHEHSGKAPAPRPVSNQCCLVGHDTAVPQTGPLPIVLLEDRAEAIPAFAASFPSAGKSHVRAIDSGGPPEASPLRI
jgi:hypothetical protein